MSNEFLNIKGQQVPLKLKRNARAKRIVLRLSRDGSAVQLTLPRRVSEKKAIAFAQTQTEWIAKQLAKKPTPIAFEPGMELSVLGEDLIFEHHDSRLTKREGDTIYIGGDVEFFSRRVKDYIKKQTRDEFSEMALDLADDLGMHLAAVRLRDTTSRWGSCSQDGTINLSWRLALAPSRVARYVIAHEVAHLEHFDHSPAFWAAVEKLHPNWENERDWLRKNGATLHAYGG
ncbi:MAG: SprT family zinc-dependent metalloprotease [Rickettsiales bacterium]|nr:SprT family zinc-dependent metalloprotease [Rickettsiales bacterium]